MVAMDEWEDDRTCDCGGGLGCRRCEPRICEVCDRLFEHVEDHADCLNSSGQVGRGSDHGDV